MSEGITPRGHVLVVGSLNADLVAHAPRLPRAGGTVLGATFQVMPGGKGANQAVAAARLGAPTVMIGRVGADAYGSLLRDELGRAGVCTDHVRVDLDVPTGTGHIVVDEAGRNTIVVASGANACLVVADVMGASTAWDRASLVVLQLEIPLVTIAATVAAAVTRRLPVVLNVAPAQVVPDDVLHAAAWLVLNEVEAEQLWGQAVVTATDALAAASALRQPGQRVVVTLGAAGAVLVSDAATMHVPAPQVEVVDTTAAGDAFVGALAAALHCGLADEAALRQAVIAGSLACTKPGAIPSLPTAAEVRRLAT